MTGHVFGTYLPHMGEACSFKRSADRGSHKLRWEVGVLTPVVPYMILAVGIQDSAPMSITMHDVSRNKIKRG